MKHVHSSKIVAFEGIEHVPMISRFPMYRPPALVDDLGIAASAHLRELQL